METMNHRNDSNDEGTMENSEMAFQCYRFRMRLQPFVRYYMPSIVVIGLIGNVLSALTFMGTKLRKLPSSHYLTALAVADSGMLLCQVMLMSGAVYPSVPGLCQFTFYSGGVFSFLSVWYVVSFTLERVIAVRYPLRRLHWCTVGRARLVVIFVAIFACLFNSHILASVHSTTDLDNTTRCYIRDGYIEAANTMNHIDTALTFVIPLILIISMNTAIATTTLCSKNRKTSKVASKRNGGSVYKGTVEEGITAGILLPAASAETFLGGESRRHVRKRLADDRKITRMLLLVSIVFLVMNFPDHVIRMAVYGLLRTNKWQTLSNVEQCWIDTTQKMSNILFHTNFAVNFFLYNLAGANFRQHLKRLLRSILRCMLEKLDDILPSKHKLRRYKITSRLFAWIVEIDQERSRFPSTSNGYGTALAAARGSGDRFYGASVSPGLMRYDAYSPSPWPKARHSARRMTAITTVSVKSAASGGDDNDGDNDQIVLYSDSDKLTRSHTRIN